jgi:hypothetical protein
MALVGFAISPSPALADDWGKVIPLPADVAKDLELLGKGFMGKALPAPPITDIHEYLNLGPGTWEYEILHGGKAGAAVRSEVYEKSKDKDGTEVWKRTIGTEFVEYIEIDGNKSFGKHLEDDLELGYTSRFIPGVMWLNSAKPGEPHTINAKIEAFKTAKPDHVSYRGDLVAKLTYVGMYEVNTKAGKFPALLGRAEYDIKIGPATVTDIMYVFFSKGVGKVAEIETTRVAAMLIYHSSTKVAKVLTKYPKH